MKILVFTDHHGSPSDMEAVKVKAKEADIIICLGDFTIFENEIEYIMNQINELPKKVLLLHGNHEDESIVRGLSEHFKNIEYIHKGCFEIENYVFIGYGGDGFSIRDRVFEGMTKQFKKTMEGKISLLLLHGPPHGLTIDIVAPYGHVGNKSFRDFIKQTQPNMVLCGHLHEHFHKRDKIGNTPIINPGPDGE